MRYRFSSFCNNSLESNSSCDYSRDIVLLFRITDRTWASISFSPSSICFLRLVWLVCFLDCSSLESSNFLESCSNYSMMSLEPLGWHLATNYSNFLRVFACSLRSFFLSASCSSRFPYCCFPSSILLVLSWYSKILIILDMFSISFSPDFHAYRDCISL